MKKILFLLTIIFIFTQLSIISPSHAQNEGVGVSIDDWFEYGEINVEWSSNDPDAVLPEHWNWIKEFNETSWMRTNVDDIYLTTVLYPQTFHYKNDTEQTKLGYIDLAIGLGEGEVNNALMILPSNLGKNDPIYPSTSYSNWRINETIQRPYLDEERSTNHLNLTWTLSGFQNEQSYYYYDSLNYYWDKTTGVLIEETYHGINQTGPYSSTLIFKLAITESSTFIIPEFSLVALLLFMVFLTSFILYFSKKFRDPHQPISPI